jgi:transposase InsO family protein
VPGVRHLAQDRLQDLGPLSEEGLEALCDRSRRPVRYANQLPEPDRAADRGDQAGKPHWGARKIRELLVRRLAGDVRIPARSTVHAVLDRHGLVSRARKRRAANKAKGTKLSRPRAQRSVVRGLQGRVQDRQWPLLLPPDGHRPGLAHDPGLRSPRSDEGAPVIEAFLRLFQERGLPAAIRSDNGLPFASPNGLYNLSKLSVFWLRLGIQIERIRPGHPQQNGRHERMHRTLKQETARPPGMNALQQQARFDDSSANSTRTAP